jgi:hypothetical protein
MFQDVSAMPMFTTLLLFVAALTTGLTARRSVPVRRSASSKTANEAAALASFNFQAGPGSLGHI